MSLRFHKNLKIQTKITMAIIVSVIVPFTILGAAFSSRLYDMIIADTISDAQKASAQTTPLVEEVIDNVTTANLALSSSDYYKSVFYNTTSGSVAALAYSEEAGDFRELWSSLTEMGYTIRIYMSLPASSSFYRSANSKDIFFPIDEAKGTYWYGIFQGTHASHLYCPSSYLSPQERESFGDNAYISYMTLFDDGEIYPCYLAIYYSSSLYSDILTNNMTFANGVSYIINEREEIVASTDNALSSTYRLSYSSIKDSLMSSNSFIERDVLGQTVYVAFYYVSKPGWFIVTVIPKEPLISQGQAIINRFIVIILLCLIVGIVMALLLSRSITGRISKVIHQMSQIRNGPPLPMEESGTNDEVGELINTYNYMAGEMQQLIKQEQKTAEQLRYAEFNALQAQINPHFLYNTMDMINWMAKEGKNEEVSEVVQRLSRFYKLTLSRKNTINSIADELEHVTLYVELQNMRHGNPIDFVVDMPDELTNFSIPKLTLQPIVENAIIHGILEKDTKQGTIIITGWEEDDDIVLLVSDDGVGMNEEQMKDVLSELPVAASKGSNVAVANIHQRLKLLCGNEYGLSYSSTLDVGTEVTIRIPKLIG